jgi:hypothetical protein
VHTGHPALGTAWSYRTFYIEPALIRAIDADLVKPARSLPSFVAGVIKDPMLAAAILALHRDIDAGACATLEAQSRILARMDSSPRRPSPRSRGQCALS